MHYNTDMEAAKEASKEDRIVLLVPTGDPDAPISEEIGYWENATDRFEGEWRHVDASWADNDPIAWLRLPEIPAGIQELATASVGIADAAE